jgi:hypothetical protein
MSRERRRRKEKDEKREKRKKRKEQEGAMNVGRCYRIESNK